MKKIQLIVCDVDGCVIMKNVTPSLCQIKFFHDYASRIQNGQSPPLVFCTGRGAEYIQPLAQLLGLMWERELPHIVENGSFLYFPYYRRTIPHTMLREKEKRILFLKQLLFEKFVRGNRGSFVPGKEGCISLIPPSNKDMASFEIEVMNVLSGKLFDEFFVTHSTTAVDITMKGVDKGSALEFLCGEIDIDPEHILAIGDANNDLPLMKVAGFVACPANASLEMKAFVQSQSRQIAKHEGTDGVIEIINHHVK